MDKNTSLGLSENIESALSYIIGPITGLFFLITERENKTVRFHAMQSTVFVGALWILSAAVKIFVRIPLLGILAGMLSWALGIFTAITMIFLIYNAYTGKMYKIPYIGEIVWAKINK